MRISGLSNQWETRDGLFDDFAALPSEGLLEGIPCQYSKIRELFDSLERIEGPDVYIGTSLSAMNFSNRDVVHQNDRTQPFAFVHVVGKTQDDLCYRTETRRLDGNRPTTEWITQDIKDADQTATLILEALLYADVPPRRVKDEKGG